MAQMTQTKTMIQPYLFFGGRCEEALEFYKTALGAKVDEVMHFNESPEPLPEGMIPAGYEKKVMHASFHVGDNMIMASDGCGESNQFGGFSLAVSVPTEADANRIFTALSKDGKVEMPLTKTFWSPCYGMVTDRFGMSWMVMVPGEGSP